MATFQITILAEFEMDDETMLELYGTDNPQEAADTAEGEDPVELLSENGISITGFLVDPVGEEY